MRLIRFTALRWLEKLGNTLLISQLGWNAVTEPNPFSIYLTPPSIVVAVFSMITLWALHPVVRRIQHHDGTLCGSLDEIAAALSIIEAESPAREPCRQPIEITIGGSPNHPVDHPLLSNNSVCFVRFILLGFPLGPAEYRLEAVLARVEKVYDSITKLIDLQDAQLEGSLIRSCLSLHKLIHLLRTCPPDVIMKVLERYDEIILPRWLSLITLELDQSFFTFLPGWLEY